MERQFNVYINEGEMDKIRKWVLLKNDIETGGDLFGLWIDKHTAVVQFVLGPGKKCRRSKVSFYQDVDYLGKAGTYLTTHHGLCNIGQWHSHHRLDLPNPSSGDESTVRRNMPTLGMNRYIVFIATISGWRRENIRANVNCFLFEIDEGIQLPVLKGKINPLQNSSPFSLNTLISREVENGAEPDKMQDTKERPHESNDDIERFADSSEPCVRIKRYFTAKNVVIILFVIMFVFSIVFFSLMYPRLYSDW